jgi:ribonuclease BN (tRNA processing enzyme)
MNRLVLLGVKGGPSLRPGGAMPTSSLLELDGRRIVVDCGLGVSKALVEAGVSLRELDLVFITHLHSDHILELGPLVHTAWVTGQSKPVTIYGPPGLSAYWDGFRASMATDIHLRITDDGRAPLDDFVRIEEIAPGPVAVEGLRVSALAVRHPPVEHAFAFRFDGSVSVTFSGDTTHFPPLAGFAKGTDVLIHEAMLPEGIDLILEKTGGGEKLRAHLNASHTVVDDAARIAADAGAGHLALHHLVPVDDPRFTAADWQRRAAAHYAGPVTVGRDGLEIAL